MKCPLVMIALKINARCKTSQNVQICSIVFKFYNTLQNAAGRAETLRFFIHCLINCGSYNSLLMTTKTFIDIVNESEDDGHKIMESSATKSIMSKFCYHL